MHNSTMRVSSLNIAKSPMSLALLIFLILLHAESAEAQESAFVNNNNYWVFTLWLFITSIVYIAGAVAMYARKDRQPVKARDSFLIVMTNLGFLVATVLRCLLMIYPTVPCILDVWETPISIGIINGTYLLRAWKMYFKFELAHERSVLRSHERDEARADTGHGGASCLASSGLQAHFRRKQAWFSRHQFLISKNFTIAFSTFLLVWFLTPAVLVTFWESSFDFDGSINIQDPACHEPALTSIFTTFSGLLLLFLCLHLAKKLRQAFDAFGIKQELRRVIKLILFSWTSIVLLVGFGDSFSNKVISLQKLLPMMWFLPMFYETSVVPVYRSFIHSGHHTDKASRPEDEHDLRTLQGVLHHPQSFQALEQYLVGCFCVESILFWRDIEDFKNLVHSSLLYATQQGMKTIPNLSGIVDQANEIADTYIYEDSTMQVNISATQRQHCEEALRLFNAKYIGVATPGHSRVSSFASMKANTTIHAISIGLQKKDGNVRSAGRASLSQMTGPGSSEEQQLIQRDGDSSHSDSGPGIGPAVAGQNETVSEDYIDPELAKYYDDIVRVFEAAHEEVFQLMRTDVFPRFIETEEYKALVKGIETERAANKELIDLKIL